MNDFCNPSTFAPSQCAVPAASSFAAIITLPVPGREEEAAKAMTAQLAALSQHLAEKKAGFYHPVNEAALVKYLAPGRPLTTQTGRGAPPPESAVSRSLQSELQGAGGVGEGGPVGLSDTSNGRVPQLVSVVSATPLEARGPVEEPDGMHGAGSLEQVPRMTVPVQHRCVCMRVCVCVCACMRVWCVCACMRVCVCVLNWCM